MLEIQFFENALTKAIATRSQADNTVGLIAQF
jgi:hypothetical protein